MEENKAQVPGTNKSPISLTSGLMAMAMKPQIGLFCQLIEDNYGNNLRINEMTGRQEWWDEYENRWRLWLDADDARMLALFQSEYGLYSPRMLESAVTIYFNSHRVNPLTSMLESLEWDGIKRMEGFLHYATRCDDTPYTREVSRLIFAGGIHRAYNPGCKFDDMCVLVGKQAAGKSTLVRWLALDDQYFREIKTISGKEGVEALRGCWIGEVAELMAMTKVKELEAVKAYITSQEDSYRTPYSRYPEVIPRRCIFVGTTNNFQFLTDKTGNRRFYPVYCDWTGYDLFDKEREIKAYIRQCWAEAVELYKRGELEQYARRDVIDQIRAEQGYAEEDDWRVGAIQDYLEATKKEPGSITCVIELWHKALNVPEERKPERSDSIDIAKIVNQIPGWERLKKAKKVSPWGVQKVWRKLPNDHFPF